MLKLKIQELTEDQIKDLLKDSEVEESSKKNYAFYLEEALKELQNNNSFDYIELENIISFNCYLDPTIMGVLMCDNILFCKFLKLIFGLEECQESGNSSILIGGYYKNYYKIKIGA
jgi:hypothetical protein